MTESIMLHMETLARKDPTQRCQAVAQVLQAENFSYTVQTAAPSPKSPQGICNYLFSTGAEKPGLLICAHYDSYPGSIGANDNTSSVCILLTLAKALREKNISASFALFDGEERDNAGSKLYAAEMNRSRITGVINLDVCGYGDTLVVYGKGHEKKKALQPFCNKKILEQHRGQIVKYLPPGDDVSFSGTGIPVLSIAMVPYWDVQYLKTLATYGGGLLGRPPEFDMILGDMDVLNTMHGGPKDSIEWIEPEAMKNVYNYLLAAITTPPEITPKRSLFFRNR